MTGQGRGDEGMIGTVSFLPDRLSARRYRSIPASQVPFAGLDVPDVVEIRSHLGVIAPVELGVHAQAAAVERLGLGQPSLLEDRARRGCSTPGRSRGVSRPTVRSRMSSTRRKSDSAAAGRPCSAWEIARPDDGFGHIGMVRPRVASRRPRIFRERSRLARSGPAPAACGERSRFSRTHRVLPGRPSLSTCAARAACSPPRSYLPCRR